MRFVWEACKPRHDVLHGDLKLEEFGIELGHVVRGVAPKIYQDPVEFFERTYLTKALRSLMISVLRRVAGIGGTPIFVFETGFGGGKTHALLAIYHLFSGKSEVRNLEIIRSLLKEAGLNDIPDAKIVIIDGHDLDPSKKPRTLWGEVARQLGKYEIIAEKDNAFIAPTASELQELLGFEKPVIILIDEIGEYLRKVMGVFSDDYDIKFEQIKGFFRTLASVITSAQSRHVLILTLPGEEAPYHSAIFSTFKHIREILGRHGVVALPVEADEIYHVIKKRLFDYVDEKAANEVARWFFEYYEQRREYFPAKVTETKYFDKLRNAYPFHPELIDILFERVSTIPGFQKTRGVLRLLALVVRDVWTSKPEDVYMILPKHVNLSNKEVLDDLTARLGRTDLQAVVRSDIESPDGTAKAQRHGDPLCLEVARAVFLYSLIGVAKPKYEVAATVRDITLAVATPALADPGRVEDVLKELAFELWYLYTSDNRYWFDTVPNINKVIEETKDSVDVARAISRVRAELESKLCRELRAKLRGFECIVWEDPPDTPNLKIVILDPQKYVFDYRGGYIEVPRELQKLYDNLSYRNTVVFLLPLRRILDQAIELARYVIACEQLMRRDEFRNYRKDLEERHARFMGDFIVKLIEAHQVVVYPHATGLRAEIVRLPRIAGNEGDYTVLAQSVKELLEAGPAYKLVVKIPAEYLWDRYFEEKDIFKREGRIELREILEDFRKSPRLPMVLDERSILIAINELLRQGRIGYQGPHGIVFNYDIWDDVKRTIEEARKYVDKSEELAKLLDEFESKFIRIGEVREFVGEVLSTEKVRELIEPYISRIKSLLEAIKPKVEKEIPPEGKLETKPAMIVQLPPPRIVTVTRPEELCEGTIQEIYVESEDVIRLRNFVQMLLQTLNARVGLAIDLKVELSGKLLNMNLSANPSDLDTLSRLLADINEVYNMFRSRYSEVTCVCKLEVRKLLAKVDKDSIDILRHILSEKAVKYRIILETK